MSIEQLAKELADARDSNVAELATRVQQELDAAASSEQRGRVLALFNMTMDQKERNLAARDQDDSLQTLRTVRAQYYKTFLVKECTVGSDFPGGGDVSVEMLMAVTNREITAGRMSESHPLRAMAVEGAGAPHLSHAQLLAKYANPAGPQGAVTAKAESSKVAYALGTIVGRKLKGFFRD